MSKNFKNLKEYLKWLYDNESEYKQIVDDLSSKESPLIRSSCVVEKVDGHYKYVDSESA